MLKKRSLYLILAVIFINAISKGGACAVGKAEGEIFFVYGTSTAGKSSICSALAGSQKDWAFENADDIFEDTLRQVLKEEEPKAFDIITKAIEEKNIFTSSAFLRGVYKFKEGSNDQEKRDAVVAIQTLQLTNPALNPIQAWEKAEEELFRRGIANAEAGRKVVLDSVCPELFQAYIEKVGFKGSIKFILVVCPFVTLAQRLCERNLIAERSGDLKEARYGFFPLGSWKELYLPRTKEDQIVVDTFSYEPAFKALQEVSEFIGKRRSADDKQIKRADDICGENPALFLEQLGFSDDTQTVAFTPRYPADLIIRTDLSQPAESAAAIIKKFI